VPTNLTRSSSILAFLATMSVVSCGVPYEEEQTGCSPAICSIIGVWRITEDEGFVTDARCLPPPNGYILYVAQNGNTVLAEVGFDTVLFNPTIGSDGTFFTGTINGSTLALSGANPDGMGTMTTARVATVAAGCNSLTGTRTLSFTEPGLSCTGTLFFTGARTVGSGCTGDPRRHRCA